MKTLQPIDSRYSVPVISDDHESEFEVQATLFRRLKDAGFDVRGEVKWRDPQINVTCRFDLVLYENGRAIRIIEIKARPVNHRTGIENTRQGRRYRLFGVPVTFVYGHADAEQLFNELQGWSG